MESLEMILRSEIERLQADNRKLEDRLKWKDESYEEMRELSYKFEQAWSVTEAQLAKAQPILKTANALHDNPRDELAIDRLLYEIKKLRREE